ncbi:hypothetical protein C5T94_28225 [Raoultella ornithinolytica]|nr:hypothetical protein C5T92_28235 [Raoultella ornithinolytica]PQH33180.1 hypothetical protein C5T94_28225 [Raoultella ornithinolytica]
MAIAASLLTRLARAFNTEPFRMTLEDAGGCRCLLWAGFLCDKVHHSKVNRYEISNSLSKWRVRSCRRRGALQP